MIHINVNLNFDHNVNLLGKKATHLEKNIFRLFHVLAQFLFTTSKTKLCDLYHELPEDVTAAILRN